MTARLDWPGRDARGDRRPYTSAPPPALGGWLRRIDKWIAGANSVLDE